MVSQRTGEWHRMWGRGCVGEVKRLLLTLADPTVWSALQIRLRTGGSTFGKLEGVMEVPPRQAGGPRSTKTTVVCAQGRAVPPGLLLASSKR